MKHRDAADSKRYRMLAAKFIDKYGIDTDNYDVIKGWRANASYFYIAKKFVRDNIDMDLLEVFNMNIPPVVVSHFLLSLLWQEVCCFSIDF